MVFIILRHTLLPPSLRVVGCVLQTVNTYIPRGLYAPGECMKSFPRHGDKICNCPVCCFARRLTPNERQSTPRTFILSRVPPTPTRYTRPPTGDVAKASRRSASELFSLSRKPGSKHGRGAGCSSFVPETQTNITLEYLCVLTRPTQRFLPIAPCVSVGCARNMNGRVQFTNQKENATNVLPMLQ